MLQGSIVALVTPMQKDGTIDKNALHNLVEWHICAKTDGLVVVGTTGEAATLTIEEQTDLISSVVKQVGKRIPVIAGTGSNCTNHTIKLTLNAKNAGADAVLIVTPYYNKPTQQGLFEHYKCITEQCDIPIFLYNVPGRTACDMLPETVARIAQLPNVIGIKEATGKIERATEILQQCDPSFIVLSGDDATAVELMRQGAQGVISVTANVAPQAMHEMCMAALTKNFQRAEEINAQLMPLHTQLFVEGNPIPVKWVLHQMGRIAEGIRLPLTPLSAKFHAPLKDAMSFAGITTSVEMR